MGLDTVKKNNKKNMVAVVVRTWMVGLENASPRGSISGAVGGFQCDGDSSFDGTI